MTMLPLFITFLLGAAVCLLLLSLSRFGTQVPVKFSVVAMLFIIFDIEVAFLYPWAVVFRQLGLPGLVAVLAFLVILAVGFLYAWQRGALEWD
jgi:NADH:ubiquinone oxidoreductase subunit 3 (subunit A)